MEELVTGVWVEIGNRTYDFENSTDTINIFLDGIIEIEINHGIIQSGGGEIIVQMGETSVPPNAMGGEVVSIVFRDNDEIVDLKNLEIPIKFIMDANIKHCQKAQCSSNSNGTGWNIIGCKTAKENNQIICTCHHLTAFAVLLLEEDHLCYPKSKLYWIFVTLYAIIFILSSSTSKTLSQNYRRSKLKRPLMILLCQHLAIAMVFRYIYHMITVLRRVEGD